MYALAMDTPMNYDDRLTAEQRDAPVNMRDVHDLHAHGWTWEDFMAWVEYNAMFTGTMYLLYSAADATTIAYGSRRRALSYNGHVTESETCIFLHHATGVPPTGPEQVG